MPSKSKRRRTLTSTSALRKEVKAYAESDKADHAEMKATIGAVESKVDTLNEHVGDVREGLGKVSGKLDGITDSIATMLPASLEQQNIQLAAKLGMKKETWRTGLKVVALVIASLLALITGTHLW